MSCLSLKVKPSPPWYVGETLQLTVSLCEEYWSIVPGQGWIDQVMITVNGKPTTYIDFLSSEPGYGYITISPEYAGQTIKIKAIDMLLLESNEVSGYVIAPSPTPTPTPTPTPSPSLIIPSPTLITTPTVPTLPTTFISPPPSAIPSVQKSSKTGLIIGGVVGAAAVAGLLYFVTRKKKL